jgi:hypothetical protein
VRLARNDGQVVRGKSKRDPSSARQIAPHLGRADNEKRKAESKATAKAAQLKLAATGANTFARDGLGTNVRI